MSYRHEIVDFASGPRGAQMHALQKYEYLLAAMRRLPDTHIILALTGDAAIVTPVPLERLLVNREYLLVSTSDDAPQTNVQIWRNSPASRQHVENIVGQCRLGGDPFPGEARLLANLSTLRWQTMIDNICAVMQTGPNVDPRWHVVPTFAVSVESNAHASGIGIVPRFRDALFERIDACADAGQPVFCFDAPGETVDSERSTFRPNRQIAFVTLYTPDIASYGRIAEANIRQYCERHDHTFHVHRAIPQEIGLSGTGNWLKPWLLHAYLAHHEWVVWLDADILIRNHAKEIEPLLADRDHLLARDIGQWPFNSGVMGFRRTEANLAMLFDLMQTIQALPDRSGVYSGNGDQYYFIEAMRQHGLLDMAAIRSPFAINTPWFFSDPDSFVVHYFGMWTEMRALMMDTDERARSAYAQ
ncbi:galactosyl transferase GMA12/MNN10 domain protein [Burkholderia ambifaria]|uniref:galactosyl transferase GMA12/MNN10 domain protein n=1 Tax=Burkholderia ambifaria TaxID=152480 RepID=UPI002012B037|nr:galactosyl transferase GMA12/MNN10 domain protein [Burkholderia ambifaria]